MNTRKNQLRSLFGGVPAEEANKAADQNEPAPAAEPHKRATSGAVKAMGLSLSSLSQEVEDARRLRESLSRGEQIVELDPAVIEGSPFSDRLSDGPTHDESFEDLMQSIADHGQQVPVLVRPHSEPVKAGQGIFQIAYGHRRVLAARALGRTVRAVIRSLDDAELVVAQGKENAERRALSFIERALFSKTLIDHGFDRATIQAALAVHKSEMSRLIGVAEMIPIQVAHAIGPAPKTGRPRWMALGELIANPRIRHWANEEITDQAFRDTADSDQRFQRVFDRLTSALQSTSVAPDAAVVIRAADGAAIGELAQSARGARLTIPISAGRRFADYVAEQLPTLHEAFKAAQQSGSASETTGDAKKVKP
ncbi:plasmid partitioning protein RepB [Tianweitania populi]|uniref:Plasmid partitioning protein RepB n=1 Tax=Tianweitania populi TaxID=1607949 RepID=A0A8J3DSR9_9HYPH|nr:plasmid partitioning protein RepB [Tianweitania populi]GHD21011.1 plasmid partitioning protein RepB [Tianweitania populi]